jgi:hypothetical protein
MCRWGSHQCREEFAFKHYDHHSHRYYIVRGCGGRGGGGGGGGHQWCLDDEMQ